MEEHVHEWLDVSPGGKEQYCWHANCQVRRILTMKLSEEIQGDVMETIGAESKDGVTVYHIEASKNPLDYIAQLEAELEMYERDETFGTLAIQLTQLESENATLKRGLQNLVADYEEIGGETFYDDSYKEAKALLADTQEEE